MSIVAFLGKDPTGRTLLLWSSWVVATSIPAFLAFISAGALVTLSIDSAGGSDSSYLAGDNVLAPIFMWATFLTLMVGPAIGFGQGLVLRTFVGGLPWLRWVLATGWSVALSFLLCIIPCAGMLLAGAVVGFAQWRVLRHHVRKAGWWIIGSAVAWLAGTLAAYLAANGSALPQDWISMRQSFAFYPLPSVLYWASACGIAVTLYAMLSGVSLAYLLARHAVTQEEV